MIGTNITQTVRTLAAATPTLLVASNPRRKFLGLQNPGAGDVTLAFGDAPGAALVAGLGWQLYASGGGFSWDGLTVPTEAVYGISTAASTVIVVEG